jgi:hypothetical protein
MKKIILCFGAVLICLYSSQICFAKEKTVTAEKLTKGDVKKALLAGEITGNCRIKDVSESGTAPSDPDSIIINGIHQEDNIAKIFFMWKIKKSARTDEMTRDCRAVLKRLDSGEWMDSNSGTILKK